MCADGRCTYPAIAGIDIDINGDVWPGSDLERHLQNSLNERKCLQCGETETTIRKSQQRRNPIFCAAVDYFGETVWEEERHRFKDWTDKELTNGWGIKPEFVDLYRRIRSPYEIKDNHKIFWNLDEK